MEEKKSPLSTVHKNCREGTPENVFFKKRAARDLAQFLLDGRK
jgi:hypothetical protein